MIGTTEQEELLFVPRELLTEPIADADMLSFTMEHTRHGSYSEGIFARLLDIIREVSPADTNNEVFVRATTDAGWRQQAIEHAEQKVAATVFMYEFAWKAPYAGGLWAMHAMDNLSVFGHPDLTEPCWGNAVCRLERSPACWGMPASTVHAVLTRCRVSRLLHIDIRTGEVIRRYEHDAPGDLIHVDVKKLGNIPDGGGWRFVGRELGKQNRAATAGKPRSKHHNPKMGTAFVHTVVDDHSRLAYAEIHDDETAVTAIAVLRRAVSWFADRGVTVQRVLSDNGSAYRSHAWRDACAELAIAHKRTRPYRPQTNGKIERFHRTMNGEWAFARHYRSELERRRALSGWLHTYNQHRLHSAIGYAAPITRLTNVCGQYS